MTSDKTIRVGVVGIGRGIGFAEGAKYVGMELVALCDLWEERLLEVGRRYQVATYTDYDLFLRASTTGGIICRQHIIAPMRCPRSCM